MIFGLLPVIREADVDVVFPMQKQSGASSEGYPLVSRSENDIELRNAWFLRSSGLQRRSNRRCIRRAERVKCRSVGDKSGVEEIGRDPDAVRQGTGSWLEVEANGPARFQGERAELQCADCHATLDKLGLVCIQGRHRCYMLVNGEAVGDRFV